MRHIRKGRAPQALARWVQDQQTPTDDAGQPLPVVNLTYNEFPHKLELKDVLIGEQDQRCAYTCRWISRTDSKVEHLKPQSVCRAEVVERGNVFGHVAGEDLDYANMVAALDVAGSDPYGEAARGNWYEADRFISPLDPECETRFRYLVDGTIRAAFPEDEAACEMIRRFRLDHDILNLDRGEELSGYFSDDFLESMTRADLEALSGAMEPPSKAKKTEFASIIRLVALDLLS